MARLLALFILIPAAELLLLIEIGQRIGLAATFALIVATGSLGAYLARRQGLGVLTRLRNRQTPGVPVDELLDGVIILIAGAVLMTPGVLTDLFGFFCLVPAGRRLIKTVLAQRFKSKAERGGAFAGFRFDGAEAAGRTAGKEPMRDVTPPVDL